eukprot:226801-Chlamydomonas_euryale.AAC.1
MREAQLRRERGCGASSRQNCRCRACSARTARHALQPEHLRVQPAVERAQRRRRRERQRLRHSARRKHQPRRLDRRALRAVSFLPRCVAARS